MDKIELFALVCHCICLLRLMLVSGAAFLGGNQRMMDNGWCIVPGKQYVSSVTFKNYINFSA